MIDLESELRRVYADVDDSDIDADHAAAERVRLALTSHSHRRSPVWAAGAAAVAAACLAVSVIALRSDRTTTAAGVPSPTCATALPAQWQQALGTTPITVQGAPAYPIAMTATDDVIVSWKPHGDAARLGVTGSDGTTRTLIALGPQLGGGYALEGNTLVVGPTQWGDSMSVVDVRSGVTRAVSLGPAMPAGYLASDGVALLDGVVYFGASPSHDGIGGVIIGYDLTTNRSRVVAHTDGPVFVRQDPRGALWQGGSVPAAGVPAAVPAGGAVRTVYSDGVDYAWNVGWRTNHTIGWTDSDGRVRSFTVAIPGHPAATPIVMAVSGPYVLLSPYSGRTPLPGGRAQLAVLDTRTGAIADLGVPMVDDSAAGRPTALALTNRHDATLRISTSGLPGLRC